ncbi:MAG TPA: SRPBCC family protein [Acidimicrobiales bacterium]|nr:SRPBCC family protein [Acidimicrobiales bacterium]
MRTFWLTHDIEAPANVLWDLLTDTDQWPLWGPSVRSATVDDGRRLSADSKGTVSTALGITLPFAITDWADGARWAWTVAGIPATTHSVEALSPTLSRVGFGVPAAAAPYLMVCRVALRRLDRTAVARRSAA